MTNRITSKNPRAIRDNTPGNFRGIAAVYFDFSSKNKFAVGCQLIESSEIQKNFSN
jgi:hypothetical protein